MNMCTCMYMVSIKSFLDFKHLSHKNCAGLRHVSCFFFHRFYLSSENFVFFFSFFKLYLCTSPYASFVAQRISKQGNSVSCHAFSNISLVIITKASAIIAFKVPISGNGELNALYTLIWDKDKKGNTQHTWRLYLLDRMCYLILHRTHVAKYCEMINKWPRKTNHLSITSNT